MLYTLSQAHYDRAELQTWLNSLTAQDALVLWQDGVLQAVKNPQLFANCANLFALEADVRARGLTLPANFQTVSFAELVAITERFSPQIAL